MAVRLATRLAAGAMGGTAVYGDLRPGDRFAFPGSPAVVYVKRTGGWYRREAFLAVDGIGRTCRTGSGTAVVKLAVPEPPDWGEDAR